MARPKMIDDDNMRRLIAEYYTSVGNNDPEKLQIPQITQYIQAHGYPEYKASSLRRDEIAKTYIEGMKKDQNAAAEAILCVYKTLDVDAFLDRNKSREKLKKALMELDEYYSDIASAAAPAMKENEKLNDRVDLLKKEIKKKDQRIRELESEVQNLKSQARAALTREKILTSVINDWVYPDIANELLSGKDLKNVVTIIDRHKLDKKLVGKDTKIITFAHPDEVVDDAPDKEPAKKKGIIKKMFDDF